MGRKYPLHDEGHVPNAQGITQVVQIGECVFAVAIRNDGGTDAKSFETDWEFIEADVTDRVRLEVHEYREQILPRVHDAAGVMDLDF
jgi:hypothetical protein